MSKFSIDEIKQSKHIFSGVSKDPYQKCISSNMRSEEAAHTADICDILSTPDNDNMPLFVMDSVSFARPPRINAEDIRHIALPAELQKLMQG